MFSFFVEIAQAYLRLAGCRVYKGHLQSDKNFSEASERYQIFLH